jgi:predicted oxidoreductase
MHPNLGAIDTPPYYALPVYSRGGAKTDEHGRVLRSDGTVIVGLYGAGNAVAGFFGRNIMAGGITIMSAMTFARQAILHALRAERGSA